MERFGLEKLHLFGQESILAPNEPNIQAQSKEVIDKWLDLAEQVCERRGPALLRRTPDVYRQKRSIHLTTLIFDMYGVIIKESKGNYNPYVKKYFPSMERSFISQFFSKAQLGEIDSHQVLSALGFADTAFHMHDYIEHYITVDKGFYSFAEKFSGMYRFVVLSNDVADWSRYITEYYNLKPILRCENNQR
jgi:hypothetical protein